VNKQEARQALHKIINDVLEIVFQTTKTVSVLELVSLTVWILTEILDENGTLDD
jgi:hypothetical protein